MFMPNRGKKNQGSINLQSDNPRDKKNKPFQKMFDISDDFYPVRGRRLSDAQKNTRFTLNDEDFFYPNRGRRSIRSIVNKQVQY